MGSKSRRPVETVTPLADRLGLQPSTKYTKGQEKALVDAIHYQQHHAGDPARAVTEPTFDQATVTGLHVYHNLAFIEKGINAEGAMPTWIPRTPPAS